jgi:hypothetical protein
MFVSLFELEALADQIDAQLLRLCSCDIALRALAEGSAVAYMPSFGLTSQSGVVKILFQLNRVILSKARWGLIVQIGRWFCGRPHKQRLACGTRCDGNLAAQTP